MHPPQCGGLVHFPLRLTAKDFLTALDDYAALVDAQMADHGLDVVRRRLDLGELPRQRLDLVLASCPVLLLMMPGAAQSLSTGFRICGEVTLLDGCT